MPVLGKMPIPSAKSYDLHSGQKYRRKSKKRAERVGQKGKGAGK